VAGDTRPLAIGQIVIASSSSRQKKKNVLLESKRKQATPSVDQVMTHIKLPPHHGPQSPLDLVTAKLAFRRLFEAF
jgi:hypothetical protein